MNNNVEKLEQKKYTDYATELFTLFAPLALKLPQLRDDPKLMKATVKAVGREGIADVVTGADKYMQQKIKEEVAKIHPNWQFWGEEGADNISEYKEGAPFLVITDPIEGTINFRSKLDDHWGSVVALVDTKTKEPVVGIVAHPAKRLFYFGIKGAGAYILAYNENHELILTNKLNNTPLPEHESFTYNASAHFSPELLKIVDKFLSFGKVQSAKKGTTKLERSRKTLIMEKGKGEKVVFEDRESGALEAVQNRGTVYFKTSNEMAAVFVILGEIGGRVTDGNGNPWSLGINTMISARSEEDYDYLKNLYEKAIK